MFGRSTIGGVHGFEEPGVRRQPFIVTATAYEVEWNKSGTKTNLYNRGPCHVPTSRFYPGGFEDRIACSDTRLGEKGCSITFGLTDTRLALQSYYGIVNDLATRREVNECGIIII